MKCKICAQPTQLIMSFGKMPIANGLLKSPDQKEFTYHLTLNLCPSCLMVQLGETIPPEKNFRPDYPYLSSTSTRMQTHFKTMAQEIIKTLAKKSKPFIVELGSNDGIMIKHLKKANLNYLGIEPCTDIALASQKLGLKVLSVFFNQTEAKKIKEKFGLADIICASSTISHIVNLNSVFKGLHSLLKPDGLVFFEDAYLPDIISKLTFDQIYDEHIYHFTGLAINNLAQRHGFSLVDMKHQTIHGGCMRYYLKKGLNHSPNPRVLKYLSLEKKLHLDKLSGYKTFIKNIHTVCSDLKKLLVKLKKDHKSIVGYGATAKSTTLLQLAKIGPNLIDYIQDNTPTKINQFTPGQHLPIKSRQQFLKDQPDYTILFAWNHQKEVLVKETAYRHRGGKFILYFPKLKII